LIPYNLIIISNKRNFKRGEIKEMNYKEILLTGFILISISIFIFHLYKYLKVRKTSKRYKSKNKEKMKKFMKLLGLFQDRWE